ncbi:MAG: methylmalonyl-CoA mutase family protein [Bacteroidales bacterium]|nr:methylmalonyl-CoA mutase family protein [Bacteroidales bacterium]
MADNQIKSDFYTNFPPITKQEWEEKVKADLKGKSPEKLTWKSFEGIDVPPFYTSEDLKGMDYIHSHPGDFPFRRGTKVANNNWFIRQDFNVAPILKSNKNLKLAINSGITELGFITSQTKTLPNRDIKNLLDEVDLERIRINFDADINSLDILKQLVEVLKSKDIKLNKVSGAIEYNPLGNFLKNNQFYFSEENDFELAGSMLQFCDENLPEFKVLSIGGNTFSNSGASLSQELGFALAMGAENLVKLSELGFSIEKIASRIQMSLGVGSNYFMEIAKIRAARQLWASIVSAFNPEQKNLGEIFIHSAPTFWNKTKLDPYVNMLRFSTESLSAAIGGSDSISTFPFNMISKEPGTFSERIARNTQIILKEESYIDKIVDPSAGSYYIENLTDKIASQAWEIFKEIENMGGFVSACKKGFIQDKIVESQQKRENNYSTRKEVLVGTNNYPNLNEVEENTTNPLIDPTQIETRAAFEFEELRKSIENLGNKKPTAVLFPYGDPVMRTARTIFATNFIGVGGFEIKDLTGIKTIDEGIEICKAENPQVVVCCSSDPEYPQFISQLSKNLNKNTLLVVAGYPSESIEQLKSMGAKHFIHIKSNIFETLSDILNNLEK